MASRIGLVGETTVKKAIVTPFKRFIEPMALYLWSSLETNDFNTSYDYEGKFKLY